jgi:MAP/microtubule affinity-regulating kinase
VLSVRSVDLFQILIIFYFRWLNLGFENDELKPFVEQPKGVKDEKLVQILRGLGYNSQAITEALERERFEEIHAAYLLLSSKKELDANLVNNSSQGGQSDVSALTQSSAGSNAVCFMQ